MGLSDLRRRDYGDPLEILLRRESETCAGCQSLDSQKWIGITKFVCRRGVRKASTEIEEMRRCKRYAEKEAAQ